MAVKAIDLVPALRQRLGEIRATESLGFKGDTEVETFLEDMLARSISHVEQYLDRTITGSAGLAEARVFDGRGGRTLTLSDFTSVTAVKVDQVDDGVFDLTLTVSTDIVSLPTTETIKTAIALRASAPLLKFPKSYGAVQVTAIWGWPSLPGGVEDVILRLTENAYLVAVQNRTSPMVQAGDFQVDLRDERVFTAALRGDLAPWRLRAA